MSIVLIGYRGSGKTTVGRRLADQLWQTFVDVDDLITARAEKTIKEIFEQDGEPAFRDIESDVVREVSAQHEQVVCLGGGSLLRAGGSLHLGLFRQLYRWSTSSFMSPDTKRTVPIASE